MHADLPDRCPLQSGRRLERTDQGGKKATDVAVPGRSGKREIPIEASLYRTRFHAKDDFLTHELLGPSARESQGWHTEAAKILDRAHPCALFCCCRIRCRSLAGRGRISSLRDSGRGEDQIDDPDGVGGVTGSILS